MDLRSAEVPNLLTTSDIEAIYGARSDPCPCSPGLIGGNNPDKFQSGINIRPPHLTLVFRLYFYLCQGKIEYFELCDPNRSININLSPSLLQTSSQ